MTVLAMGGPPVERRRHEHGRVSAMIAGPPSNFRARGAAGLHTILDGTLDVAYPRRGGNHADGAT